MKKVNKPISKQMPPVRLYLDDIESIYQAFKKTNKEIEIRTENYQVDDIKQLKEIGINKIYDLTMYARFSGDRVLFKPSYTEVYFLYDTLENRGICSEIIEILENRKVKLGRFLSSIWAFYLNLLLAAILCFSALNFYTEESYVYFGVFLGFLTLSIISIILLYRLDNKRHSCILLVEKKEETSFWKRNKDTIWIVVITAIISFIFTSLGFLLFGSS